MPAISTTPTRVSGESKLNVVLAIAPRSKSKIAATYVGTLTSNTSPARSPCAMVRVGAADAPRAATLVIEPNSWTNAVR